jgi:hypothetical protein
MGATYPIENTEQYKAGRAMKPKWAIYPTENTGQVMRVTLSHPTGIIENTGQAKAECALKPSKDDISHGKYQTGSNKLCSQTQRGRYIPYKIPDRLKPSVLSNPRTDTNVIF